MSHFSDLDPCGLLFTLVTPSCSCVCVVVCASGQSAESQSARRCGVCVRTQQNKNHKKNKFQPGDGQCVHFMSIDRQQCLTRATFVKAQTAKLTGAGLNPLL